MARRAVRALPLMLLTVVTAMIPAWPGRDSAHAWAPLSARYRGTVTVYGQPAAAGASVTAYAGGQRIAQATAVISGSLAVYDLAVPPDDPVTPEREGAAENEVLSFRVDGVPADEQETFNAGEDRLLDLHVTRMEVCLAAYEDVDRDNQRDPAEQWLAGVEINVLQFFVVRSYVTTGGDEPSCALHEAHATVVRAVDWPAGFDPPSGQGQPAVVIDSPAGTHTAEFAFVRQASSVDTPTSPATASPTTVPATSTPSPTPTPAAQLTVNSAADPGDVGDDHLTLREAMRLAVGDLLPEDLSAAERRQVSGTPGAESRDRITFDTAAFPPDAAVTIEVQPPIVSGYSIPDPQPDRPGAADLPRVSLPAMSTGGDAIDASGSRVILSSGLGTELFDGLVITSDGNSVQGLELRDFDTAVIVTSNARWNLLGGSEEGEGLTLANNIAGIEMLGAGVSENRVLGSRIGVDRTGHTGMGNATHGVRIADGAHGNVIGAAGAGNVISANFLDGVAVLGAGSDGNAVVGNLIGTDASGTEPIGNGLGVVVGSGAQDTIVGGSSQNEGNVISGNVGDGLWVQSEGTQDTLVRGNHIGSSLDHRKPVANGGCGILLSDGAQGTVIGGASEAGGNRISYNADAGVRIRGRDTVRNSVLDNSITANGGPGIDLVAGGNRSIAAPIFRRPSTGAVDGFALPLATVQIYSDAVDEGATFEGTVLTDATGYFLFEAPAPFSGPVVTATVTDDEGNTSAFGRQGNLQPTATVTATATATRTVTPTASPPTPTTGTPAAMVTPTPTASGTPPTLAPTPTGAPGTGALAYFPITYVNYILFANLHLVPAAADIRVDDEVWIDVRLDYATGFYGVQFEIAYPTDLVTVPDEDPLLPGMQIEPGTFPDPSFTFVAENRIDAANGRIYYSCTAIGVPPQEGSGVVARFRVRGRSPGAARFTFELYQLSNGSAESLRLAASGATITVLAPTATPPPTVTPPPAATRTSTPPRATDTPVPTLGPSATAPATGTPPVPSASATSPATRTPSPGPTAVSTATATLVPFPTFTATASAPPGTPSTVPSATATLVPTQATPPTAMPPDGCAHPLVNGGFENDLAWARRGGRPPRFGATVVHGGLKSALLGILPGERNELAYSTLWQPVVVPASARSAIVAAWAYQAAEPGGGPDRQLLLVYDIDPDLNLRGQRSPIARVFGERIDARTWQRRTITFDVSPYRGRTLWLYATVLNDGLGGRAWMYLDDMDVAFCP